MADDAPAAGGNKDHDEIEEDSFTQALDRCIAAATKGFAIGAGLRGGLVVFAVIARLRKASSLLRSGGGRIGDKHLVRNAFKETLRYGFFLSAFAGVYTSVDELISSILGFERSARWRSLVAGAVAGPALLLTGPKTRHTSMALYILMRAAVLAARCGVKSRRLGWLFKPVAWEHGLGTARSSLFLATYCASAWGWTCLLFRLLNRCTPTTLALGTFPTGLALTIEKKSRRMEIALYCFSRALESLGLCITDSDAFQPHHHRLPKRTDVVLFSFATSIIMHCYAQERDVFRSKYLNVLDWVFGVPPSKGDTAVQKRVERESDERVSSAA